LGGVVVKVNENTYYRDLYEVTSRLNSERAPKAVLQSIVESVANTMDAKACSLMLLTSDRETLLHTVACGLSDWYLRKGPIEVDKSLSQALEGKPISVLNASEDKRVMFREQAKKEGIASILSVPVRLRDKIIGVLRVYTAQAHRFSRDEISYAETVANLGAVALENLQAYDIIHQEYENFRQDMLQWRAEMGNEGMFDGLVGPPKEDWPEIRAGG
jgi:signal transduction protein with GAF and PtsI domain